MAKPKKRFVSLILTEAEDDYLEAVAEEKQMSKIGILKQALRTYQMIDRRLKTGERIWFENDKQLRAELVLT